MKTRFALIAVLAATSLSAIAQPADAAKKKRKSMSVSMTSFVMPECTVGPDRVRMAIGFDATVKRKNVKPPKSITTSYKLTDPATGVVLIAESVKLAPKEYVSFGEFLGFTVGTPLAFEGSFSFKSPVNGKRVTGSTSQSLTVPTNDELVAGGIKSCV
ncbi:MAG: hypothetical protein WAO61_01345 [Solirubrobacterales bacterium]